MNHKGTILLETDRLILRKFVMENKHIFGVGSLSNNEQSREHTGKGAFPDALLVRYRPQILDIQGENV